MVLKALIISPHNIYLKEGIQQFIANIFRVDFKKSIAFFTEYKTKGIVSFDLIILHLGAGESNLCHPILRYRRDGTLIIGFSDTLSSNPGVVYSRCFSNTSFCTYDQPLKLIRETIVHGWFMAVNKKPLATCANCNDCHKIELTNTQRRIVERVFYEHTYQEISYDLNINTKVISSHIMEIRRKFNLKTKGEFLNFVNHWFASKYTRPQCYIDTAVRR